MPVSLASDVSYVPLNRLHQRHGVEFFRARSEGALGFAKVVMLKQISMNHPNAQARRRLAREAVICSRLNSHNVVGVYDFYQQGERVCLTMEMVDGVGLDAIIATRKRTKNPVPTAAVIALATQLLDTLDYLHRARDPKTSHKLEIVHRALTPDHIILDRCAVIKLSGFGYAQFAGEEPAPPDELTRWSAPEALQGGRFTPASDVYSVAVILYELLCLRALRDGPDVPTALVPAELDRRLRDLPPDAAFLAPLFKRALAPNPAERYRTAGELVAALRSLPKPSGTVESPAQLLRGLVEESLFQSPAETPQEDVKAGLLVSAPAWNPWNGQGTADFSFENDLSEMELDPDEQVLFSEVEGTEPPAGGAPVSSKRKRRAVNLAGPEFTGEHPLPHHTPTRVLSAEELGLKLRPMEAGREESPEPASSEPAPAPASPGFVVPTPSAGAAAALLGGLPPSAAAHASAAQGAAGIPGGALGGAAGGAAGVTAPAASSAPSTGAAAAAPRKGATAHASGASSERRSPPKAAPLSASPPPPASSTLTVTEEDELELEEVAPGDETRVSKLDPERTHEHRIPGTPTSAPPSTSVLTVRPPSQPALASPPPVDASGPSAGAPERDEAHTDPRPRPLTSASSRPGNPSALAKSSFSFLAPEDSLGVVDPALFDSLKSRPEIPLYPPSTESRSQPLRPLNTAPAPSVAPKKPTEPEVESLLGPGGFSPFAFSNHRSSPSVPAPAREGLVLPRVPGGAPEHEVSLPTTRMKVPTSQPVVEVHAGGSTVITEWTPSPSVAAPPPQAQPIPAQLKPVATQSMGLVAGPMPSLPATPVLDRISGVDGRRENVTRSSPREGVREPVSQERLLAESPTVVGAIPSLSRPVAGLGPTPSEDQGPVARLASSPASLAQASGQAEELELEDASVEQFIPTRVDKLPLASPLSRPPSAPGTPASSLNGSGPGAGSATLPAPHRAAHTLQILVITASGVHVVELPPEGLHVGRSARNDLVMADSRIAARHAQLIRDAEGVILRCTPGETVEVRGARLAKVRLTPGIPVMMGQMQLLLPVLPSRNTLVPVLDYHALTEELMAHFPDIAARLTLRAEAGLKLEPDSQQLPPRPLWTQLMELYQDNPDPRPLKRLLEVLVREDEGLKVAREALECLRILERIG